MCNYTNIYINNWTCFEFRLVLCLTAHWTQTKTPLKMHTNLVTERASLVHMNEKTLYRSLINCCNSSGIWTIWTLLHLCQRRVCSLGTWTPGSPDPPPIDLLFPRGRSEDFFFGSHVCKEPTVGRKNFWKILFPGSKNWCTCTTFDADFRNIN